VRQAQSSAQTEEQAECMAMKVASMRGSSLRSWTEVGLVPRASERVVALVGWRRWAPNVGDNGGGRAGVQAV
jgi:hypothetical protein